MRNIILKKKMKIELLCFVCVCRGTLSEASEKSTPLYL